MKFTSKCRKCGKTTTFNADKPEDDYERLQLEGGHPPDCKCGSKWVIEPCLNHETIMSIPIKYRAKAIREARTGYSGIKR